MDITSTSAATAATTTTVTTASDHQLDDRYFLVRGVDDVTGKGVKEKGTRADMQVLSGWMSDKERSDDRGDGRVCDGIPAAVPVDRRSVCDRTRAHLLAAWVRRFCTDCCYMVSSPPSDPHTILIVACVCARAFVGGRYKSNVWPIRVGVSTSYIACPSSNGQVYLFNHSGALVGILKDHRGTHSSGLCPLVHQRS